MIGRMKTNDASQWPAYVEKVSGTTSRKAISDASGVHPSSVSRWFNGATQPTDAGNVAALAVAYKRNPVEAFVAAGLLELKDAIGALTPDEVALLAEVSGHQSTDELSARRAVVGKPVKKAARTSRKPRLGD